MNENIFPAALRSIDIEDLAAVNIVSDMDKRYQMMIYLLSMLPIWIKVSIRYRTTEM